MYRIAVPLLLNNQPCLIVKHESQHRSYISKSWLNASRHALCPLCFGLLTQCRRASNAERAEGEDENYQPFPEGRPVSGVQRITFAIELDFEFVGSAASLGIIIVAVNGVAMVVFR